LFGLNTMKVVYFFLVLLAVLGIAAAQEPSKPPAPPPGTPSISTTAQEVVLDMVFRDKKGRSIHDIRPEEVHVLEEGTEQKLNSFRLVEGKTAEVMTETAAGGRHGAVPLDPMREIRLVTLVFQSLGPDDKRFFQQAVKDLLGMAPEPNLYFSVMTIDQRLHLIQPFTANHEALLGTLNKSLTWSYVQYQTQTAEVKQQLEQVVSGDAPQLTTSSGGPPSASAIGGLVSYQLAKMQYDMLQFDARTDREFDERATMMGLMNLVRAEASLPGRKMVIYFNPWFRVPPTVDEQYKNLKSLANRSNVTFYTVDTKGLVSYSQESGGRSLLNGSAKESRNMAKYGSDQKVTIDQARAGEAAENSVRDNPQLWLTDLAKDTGGAAIIDTNDWKAPLRIAMEEVRTYFEAAYTPEIATYDGKFRKITVRIDRPDVQVHTRSGYYALPVLGGQQLLAYELPLLNALAAPPATPQVSFRAAAFRFSERGQKVEYMLALEAPLQQLVFEPHPDKKIATVNAGLMAVLKDARGEIVDKFSKEFAVQVDLDKVDAYKAGNLVQTFRAELAPGRHTLEAVLMDRQGNKIGVKRISLMVPAPSEKLALSDIVIVRRSDSLKDNQILDAFYFEGGKIIPTLTDALKGGPGNILPFYFAVYPDPAIPAPPTLTMSFFKDEQPLGSADAPLPAPQKDGRIPYIANLPADKFTPGNYEVHVGVSQGNAKAEGKIAFRVE